MFVTEILGKLKNDFIVIDGVKQRNVSEAWIVTI
jgi:hypothetical protein